MVPKKYYPVHPDKNRTWDKGAARRRQKEYATKDGEVDWELVHTFHLWVDDSDPNKWESHKFPVVDIVDGKPYAIWHAITNARARLPQSNLSAEAKKKVEAKLRGYYKRAGEKWESNDEFKMDIKELFYFIDPFYAGSIGDGELVYEDNYLLIEGSMDYDSTYKKLIDFFNSYDSDKPILMEINSPGGAVNGVFSAYESIKRSKVPVYVFSPSMLTSAAYLLASAADKVFVSPDARVGSIGVIATVPSYKRLFERMGVDIAVVRSGENKAPYTPYEELTEKALEKIKEDTELYYNMFVNAVDSSRKIPNDMKDGKVVIGGKAVELGLADGVALSADEVAKMIEDVASVANEVITRLKETHVKTLATILSASGFIAPLDAEDVALKLSSGEISLEDVIEKVKVVEPTKMKTAEDKADPEIDPGLAEKMQKLYGDKWVEMVSKIKLK